MVNASVIIYGILSVTVVILLIAFLFGAVIAGWFIYKKWKRYQEFQCIIFRKDGFGQQVYTTDKAGIFVDNKTKNKRFFLKKNNVGLDPNNVPFLQGHKIKTVFLLQEGLKNFRFIDIKIDSKQNVILHIGEEDINWGANAYERQKKMFGQNWLEKYLPYLLFVFTIIIILIICIQFFKEFHILSDVATSFKEAAEIFAQVQSGTVVIPSPVG